MRNEEDYAEFTDEELEAALAEVELDENVPDPDGDDDGYDIKELDEE
jgi:hypothetical protein